jgi:hypothetical protein
MNVEIAPFYAPVWKSSQYAHKLQVAIPSLGTYYDNLRVPDLLLTALYSLDPKTSHLVKDVKLIFQTDGPSKAQLNFMHGALTDKYAATVYRFDVNMDVMFGEGVIKKNTAKVNGNVGAEKVAKAGVDIGIEVGEERPGTKTVLHARLSGMLSAKEGLLEAWGDMVGASKFNRS